MDNLERAYFIAAEVVAKYGAAYLPIFERLHSEIKAQQQQQELVKLSCELAAVGEK
ncbi:hypothetical protein ACTJJB_22610 [Chitinophaga sp. 22536]|uniref:hypothetical protein n=1 Tax=unclassified Chitinophaga TaxID=2619133 RepID=UPI003F86A1B0